MFLLNGRVWLFVSELIQHLIGYIGQDLRIAHFIAFYDIFFDDSPRERAHIVGLLRFAQMHQLGKSSGEEIGVQCAFSQSDGLRGEGRCVHSLTDAVFAEGEREQFYLVVASRQMCSQFSTEQIGIASGDNHVHSPFFVRFVN